MPKFIIVRHGSNAANQSMTLRKVLGVVIAANEDDARAAALDNFTFYNNQHVELIKATEASRGDKLAARDLAVINAIEQDKELNAWAENEEVGK